MDYFKDWSWFSAPDYPLAAQYSRSVVISPTEMLVCGGKVAGQGYIRKCNIMDALKKESGWVTVTDMPHPAGMHAMAAYEITGSSIQVLVVGSHSNWMAGGVSAKVVEYMGSYQHD